VSSSIGGTTVNVTSDVQAEVFVNKERIGTTPIRITDTQGGAFNVTVRAYTGGCKQWVVNSVKRFNTIIHLHYSNRVSPIAGQRKAARRVKEKKNRFKLLGGAAVMNELFTGDKKKNKYRKILGAVSITNVLFK